MKTGNLSPTPMFAIHCSFQYSEGILKPHLFGTFKSKPLNVLGLVIARLFLLVRQFIFDFVYQSSLPFLLLVRLHAVLWFLAGLRPRATSRHPSASHEGGCPWRDVYSCPEIGLLVVSLLRNDFAHPFGTKPHLGMVSIHMLLGFVE